MRPKPWLAPVSVPPGTMHRMTSATAADYGWIRSPSSLLRYALDIGYTLTLVRGVSPDELLRMAGADAEPPEECAGLGELIERHQELVDECDDWPESFIAGAFTVQGEGGDWALLLDVGGDLGTRPGFMESLSAGTRAVSHASNGGKPMDFFHWYENGELRTTFEWPSVRTGSTPDDLNAVMTDLGLDPSGDQATDVDRKAAVFALSERLTGVQVTEELLAEAVYRVGEVPEEPAEEWESVVIDITDAHGERTYMELRRDQL